MFSFVYLLNIKKWHFSFELIHINCFLHSPVTLSPVCSAVTLLLLINKLANRVHNNLGTVLTCRSFKLCRTLDYAELVTVTLRLILTWALPSICRRVATHLASLPGAVAGVDALLPWWDVTADPWARLKHPHTSLFLSYTHTRVQSHQTTHLGLYFCFVQAYVSVCVCLSALALLNA